VSLLLALATALLFSLGTWLLLQRRLSRLIIGLGLIGHGANLLLMLSGDRRGVAPFVGATDGERVADPMPQALALTAIVIAFGLSAFLLALAYRSWQLTGDDLVEDDVEDRRIASRQTDVDEEVADQVLLGAAGDDGPGDEG
jgi:multicomponent Na+:H+ antiporter subunit C